MNVKTQIDITYPETDYSFIINSFYKDLNEVERHIKRFFQSDVIQSEDDFFVINSIGQKTVFIDQLIYKLQLDLLKLGPFFKSESLTLYESRLKTYSYMYHCIITYYELINNIVALKEDSYPSQIVTFELLVFIDTLKHPELRVKLLESFNDILNQLNFSIGRNEVKWDEYLLSYLTTNLETIIQDSQQIYISKPDILFDRIYALIEICSDEEILLCFKILRSIITEKIRYIENGLVEENEYLNLKNLFSDTTKIINYLEGELLNEDLRLRLIHRILELNDMALSHNMYKECINFFSEIEALRSQLRIKWIKKYFKEFLDILYRLFDFYSKLRDDTQEGSTARFKITRRINTIENKINFMEYYINK